MASDHRPAPEQDEFGVWGALGSSLRVLILLRWVLIAALLIALGITIDLALLIMHHG